MPENPQKINARNTLSNRIPLIYAMGYSFSQYFIDRDIKQICIYCEEADYSFGQQICFDLSMSFDVDVRLWLTNNIWSSSANFPNQNFTAHPYFNHALIEQLNNNDNILIICSERDNESISKIKIKGKKFFHIFDLWMDLWFRAIIGKRLQKIRNTFPFLPIILSNELAFPNNKEHYSDIEKWIVDNKIGHYSRAGGILEQLKQPDAIMPKTYKDFNYDISEIIEMLDGSRTIINGGGGGYIKTERLFK
jgi:hypothetical protein